MATLAEIHDLKGDGPLLDRVEAALFISALDIFNSTPSPTNQTARLKMANKIYQNSRAVAKDVLPSVIAANKSATVAQIKGATDAAIQNNVDSVINLFADRLS